MFINREGSERPLKKKLIFKTAKRRQHLESDTKIASATAVANDPVPELVMELRELKSLKGAKRRSRKTSPAQLERVVNSIARLRQCVPILIDADGNIIDGHIIAEALMKLGAESAWCVVVDHLSEAEARLLRLSLNRISETGEWDLEELRFELIELGELDLDLSLTGFSLPELDIITLPDHGEREEEHVPEPPLVPVAAVGDLWLLGEHRLLCGDSTKTEIYSRVLDGQLASSIFMDPPWNLAASFISGSGKGKSTRTSRWRPAKCRSRNSRTFATRIVNTVLPI